jgi:hypothetical protein
MKTTKLISLFLAAGLAGAAFARIGLSPALASIPGMQLFALAAGAGLLLLALSDVTRRIDPLRPRAAIARPTLGTLTAAWQVPAPSAAPAKQNRAA